MQCLLFTAVERYIFLSSQQYTEQQEISFARLSANVNTNIYSTAAQYFSVELWWYQGGEKVPRVQQGVVLWEMDHSIKSQLVVELYVRLFEVVEKFVDFQGWF